MTLTLLVSMLIVPASAVAAPKTMRVDF